MSNYKLSRFIFGTVLTNISKSVRISVYTSLTILAFLHYICLFLLFFCFKLLTMKNNYHNFVISNLILYMDHKIINNGKLIMHKITDLVINIDFFYYFYTHV